jgi:hypothetical protein
MNRQNCNTQKCIDTISLVLRHPGAANPFFSTRSSGKGVPMKTLGLVVVITALSAGVSGQSSISTSGSQQAAFSASEKPRVFITDSQSWEMSGAGGGANGAWGAQTHGGARPQTAEIIKTFGERCPQVMVNNKQDRCVRTLVRVWARDVRESASKFE